jgi:hypothetical protein
MAKHKRSPRRMKDLASKKLTEKQAKEVRGGGGAIQKIRGANPGAQACDGASKDA